MFTQKHLSKIIDGCFYLYLILLVSCTTSPPKTQSDNLVASQSTTLDLGYAVLKKPVLLLKKETRATTKNPRFKIAAVGDIMLGTNYPFNHLPENGINLLVDVKSILKKMDVSFGNLEGVLLEEGEPVKKCNDLQHCYLFKSPVSFARQLKDAGFNMMSLANNHARDFGEQGRISTMSALDRHGILHSGIVDDFATVTLKSHKFVMIAFAPFRGANDMLDIPLATEVVKKLALQFDVVIVSMHGGAEGEDKTRLPFATEYFFNEDRGDVVEFAHAMVDSGADVILGHGPHVPRAIELYKDRLIAYSLGNFATYYGINVAGLRGLAPILELEISHQGQFLSGKIHSFRQNRPFGPQEDTANSSAKLIQQISKQDFPDSLLEISVQGEIKIKSQESKIKH